MHEQAHNWMASQVKQLPLRRSVLEFGSRNVNGSPRPLFVNADKYIGVDIREGEGVDIVADAADYRTEERFDTVVCMEVLEHTNRGREICCNAYRHLLRGGVFLVTAAGIGREPHSAIDGGAVQEGEYYQNVSIADLRWWCSDFQLVTVNTDTTGDIYALCIKW